MGQKKKQNPQRCNVRSLTSVMNNAWISNEPLTNLIINLIKLTKRCCVVFGMRHRNRLTEISWEKAVQEQAKSGLHTTQADKNNTQSYNKALYTWFK